MNETRSAPEPLIDVFRRLQKVMEAKDKPAFLAFFAPDVEYHYHVGTRPLLGIAWVEKFITKYWANNAGARLDITHWAENDGRLFMEGVEQYVNADGYPVTHRYMAIIEFRDGLITGWRDYFQMADPNAGK